MKINRIERRGSIIDDLLAHHGIEDTEGFKTNTHHFDESDLIFKRVANIQDAVGYTVAALQHSLKFGILVDDDADGFTSASILHNYLTDLHPEINIQTFHHEHKTHGLTEQVMNELQAAQLDIIFIPDAGVNDVMQHNLLTFAGAKVIVIDHHIIEEFPVAEDGEIIPTTAIIVSNQNSNNAVEINRGLTGAGMVLRFCEAIDFATGNNFAEKYYDLAAIGQIGDASNISDPEIHHIVMKGLSNINNHFLKCAIGDHAEKEIAPPIGMSFSVIPMINAITRVGTVEEKQLLFRALTQKDEPEIVTEMRRRKNKETGKFEQTPVEFTEMQLMVETLAKVKARQTKLIATALECAVYKNVTGSVAIIELEDFNEKIGGITGLIANKVVSKLSMPALVLVKRGDEMIGSGRGYEKLVKDLRQWVLDTELCEWAKGHDNAFGTSIHVDKYEEFIQKAQTNIEGSGDEKVFDVIEYQSRNVNHDTLYEAINYQHLYGGTVEAPKFFFENIEIEKSNISIMSNGTCLSFWYRGITFIAFGLPVGSADAFEQGFKSKFAMNFLGTPSLSNWRGKETLQVVIDEYEFYVEDEEAEFDEMDDFIF